MSTTPTINIHLGDCMELMQGKPDKFWDLAIVDPEYGKNAANMTMGKGLNKRWAKKDWDKKKPNQGYFDELFRTSKNQIIWGGNYHVLPITNAWIFWDKCINGATSFSDGELAWTSFKMQLKKATILYNGFLGADIERIHPTQKPVALYRWLLENYAKPGDRILDTHGGSMSSAIACHDLGFDLDIIELDPDYYADGKARFERHVNRWHSGLGQAIHDPNDYTTIETGLFAKPITD